MRWPWVKQPSTGGKEALERAREQREEVRAVSKSLREMRERNHLAELLAASMHRRPQ